MEKNKGIPARRFKAKRIDSEEYVMGISKVSMGENAMIYYICTDDRELIVIDKSTQEEIIEESEDE